MNLIVALTKNNAIGKNNDLLFHIKKDMKFFKETTTGKVVVMGKKTYLSLPNRPLKNRTNIVLSRDKSLVLEGAIVVNSIEQLFTELKNYPSEEIFVIGGAKVYNLLMQYCDNAFITRIDRIVPADTFMDNIEENGFVLAKSSENFVEDGVEFRFETYTNTNKKEL